MANNTGDLGVTLGTDLAVQSFDQIEATGEQLPSPSQVTNAVVPVISTIEWRERKGCGADETSRGVGVETKQKGDKKMMRVPKRLERLLSNTVMGGSVHQ